MVPNMWCWMILTGETMISGWCFYPWTGDGFSSMNPHRLTKVFHSHSSQIHCHSFPLPSNPSMLKFPHWWTIWGWTFLSIHGNVRDLPTILPLFSHWKSQDISRQQNSGDSFDPVTAKHGSIRQDVPPFQRMAGVPQAPDTGGAAEPFVSVNIYIYVIHVCIYIYKIRIWLYVVIIADLLLHVICIRCCTCTIWRLLLGDYPSKSFK